jgi:hypothetical protein
MVEDPGHPFWLCVTYYNRVNSENRYSITDIHINLTTDTNIEIGNKIVSYLNDYLESKVKPLDLELIFVIECYSYTMI